MTLAPHQHQRTEQSRAGAFALGARSVHSPAAVTDDTQVLGRCLSAARVVSSLVSTGGGFGRRPFPFRSQHVPLPHRAVWAGRMRALHGAALRSRFIILIPQREVPAADPLHQLATNLSNAAERHRLVSYAAISMKRTCSNRRPSNWVIQTIWSDRK